MKSYRRLATSSGVLLLCALALLIVVSVAAERTGPPPAVPRAAATGFPLRFEGSEAADGVTYSAGALGGRITFEDGALGLTGSRDTDAWRMAFAGATRGAKPSGFEAAPGRTNALFGRDASSWRSGATAYRSLRVPALYPGVDLVASGTVDRLTVHLDFAAGTDSSLVAFHIEGARARLEQDGSVRWSTDAGDFVVLPPSAWFSAGDRRKPLAASFDLNDDGGIALLIPAPAGGAPVGVDLTVWQSEARGSALLARGLKVALDAEGAAYVTGSVPAPRGARGDAGDAFVAKLDRAGSDFAWVTYVGTDRLDVPSSIAIDASGRIAIAGAAGDDAFAAELSAEGGSLAWLRVVPGSGSDRADAVAFDATGRVWIAGATSSTDLPVTANAAQAVPGGSADAFVTAFGPDGAVWYTTYFGGSADDDAVALAPLPGGGMALAGDTRSAGLATADAAQFTPGGGKDIFVTTIAADGSIVRTTYLGGAADETAAGLAADRRGRLVVAGSVDGVSASPEILSVGVNGGRDAFVATLAADGSAFAPVTRLGGPGDDELDALAIDSSGHIVVAGRTSGDFPTTGDPRRSMPRGGVDAFVATLDKDGATLLHAGLIGGGAADAASGVAVDGNGKVWLVGATASSELNGASASNAQAGGGSGFVATIDDRPGNTLPQGSCPGTISFDNSAGTGLWQTATNWSTNVVPGAADNVCISGFAVTLSSGAASVASVHVEGAGSLTVSGGTLNIAGASEVVAPATLTLSGGTIGGAGNLTVDTKIAWSSGTMSGTGTTTSNGGIDFGGGYSGITRTVNLASGGTSSFSGAAYTITVTTPGVLNVQAGATFDYQNDGGITGTGTVNNAGSFLRTTSTGVGTISTVFNNTGLVDVQAGTLALSDNGAHTGDFDATGAILDISAGTQTFSATSDITGTEVRFTGASATLSGSYNVTGTTTISSGTANFTGATLNLINVGSTLTVTGGAIATFSSGEALTPTTFNFTGGTFGGSDNLAVSGLLTWSNGAMGGTGVTTANGGIAFGGGYQTLTRTMNNTSGHTATYSGAAYSLTITTPGVFNNLAGATFDQQCDASITGTGPFNNPGTFLRTTSTGVATINAPFSNTGLVDVQSGRLVLNGNGAHTGDFDATGAILEIGAGTQTFSATSDITGTDVSFTGATATLSGSYNLTGTTTISSGTANFTGATLNLINVGSTLTVTGSATATFSSGEALTPTTFNLTGGSFGGSDNLTVSGLLTWSNGTMSGTGTTTANGGIALGGGYQTLTRTLNNAAGSTATYSGAAYTLQINPPGVFNNQVGATFDQQCDASINGTGPFNNAGTFLRTTSTGVATINAPFSNTNIVDVQSGRLVLNSSGAHTGDFDATGAILEIGAGTQTFSSTSDITATDVFFTGATATLSGSYSVTGTTTISSGLANFTGGTLNLINVGSTLAVTGSGTATFSSGETVAPTVLNFTGGTIGGSDAITVSGLFTWSSGTMGGTGVTTANGGIALGGGYQTLTRVLNNASGSTATYSGAAYGITINSPGVFNNQAGATFDQQCDASISGTGIFNNPGTFLRTTSTGTSVINSIFNNTSVVDVQSGKLSLNGNGTHTGDFDSTGAVLDIGGGTQTFSATSDFTGSEVDFTGATATLSGTYNIAGTTTITSGTANFTGAALNIIDIGAALVVSGGTATFSSGETLTPTTLDLTGGTLGGSDNINVGGLFTWSSGTMSGNGVTNAGGDIALGNGYQALNRVLNNLSGSTATYSGPAYAITITPPGVFNNQAGATFDQQCDASISGTGPFNNAGTFLRTTSSATAVVTSVFNNTGTVDVQSGKLSLNGNGTHTGDFDATGTALILGGSSTQTFSSTSDITGTEVEFQGSNATFSGSYNVTGTTRVSYGSGTVNFTGATLNLISAGSTIQLDGATTNFSSGETVTTTNLNMTSYATLTGSDTIIVNGPFDWNGGIMTGSGTTTLRGGIALGVYTNSMSRTVNNANNGTTTVSGASGGLQIDVPGVFNNQAGSTFEASNDYNIYGLGTFNNAGTFNRSGSSGTVTIQPTFNNSGNVNALSGTLYFDGNAGNFNQTAGVTRLNGGAIQTYQGMTIAGGTLTGTGTITGPVANTGGSVAPGQSPGLLSIEDGDYTQGAGGAFAAEIGGLTTDTQYDHLDIGGTSGTRAAALSGTLNVSLVNGFVPAVGNTFTIMTAATRSGTFTTKNFPALTGGNVWTVIYNPTNVVLGVAPPTSADLVVTNVDAPDPVNAGSNVAYTMTVHSNGPDPATNVTLTDPLDASTSFVSATPSQGTCSNAAGTVTCSLGGLANGATATISIVAATSAASVPAIANTATASATEADLVPANNSATATTGVTPVADLSMTKGDAPDPINAGGSLTYTLNVSNAGPNTATGLTVTDTLPAGVSFVSAAGTGWTCNQAAGVVTCTRASLAVGAAPAITIVVTAPGSPGSITNNATLTTSSFDPTTPNNASATTSVTAVADLTISKGDAPDPVNAAANLVYTLNVSNSGPSTANSLTVTDTLPVGTTYVSATGTGWTCNHAAGVVTCTRTSLAVAAAPAITITVTAPNEGGSITNNAAVAATEFDPTSPNTASATTTVTPIANLSVVKSDSPDPVNPASNVTYQVDVSNAGPSTAASLTVTDTLPAGTTYVSAIGTGWTCNHAAGVVTCTRPTLAPGAAPTITIVATAPAAGGTITNNVSVSATTTDLVPANNSDSEGTTVRPAANLTIAKSDSPDPVDAGATLTYTLDVTNAGPDAAQAVTVTDTLPAGVTFVSATGTGWACSQAAGVVTCTRATIAVGAAPSIAVTVTAPAAGGAITNNCAVTASGSVDLTPANNTDLEGTTVTPVANLSITKTDSPDPANTSSTLVYTVTVANAGPSTANSLTMTDTLPAGVTFVSATGTGWTCNQAAGVVTCTRPSLAVATAPAITITVTTPATPGLITNTATIAATEADRVPANNTASAGTSVAVVTADLSITKTDSPDPVNANGALTYTINVANAGPDPASTTTVSDTLPVGVTFVSGTGTGWACINTFGAPTGTVTCTRPSLAVGAAPTITIVVTAPTEGGSITNTATVSAPEADNNAANNTASATTAVTAIANLTIAKTDAPDPVAAGGALTYTINVTNVGPSTATNLSVVDVLPAGVAFGSASGTGWTCNNAAGTVTCTRPNLAVGAAPAITISVTAPGSPGSISNTATVTATENDPSTPNTSTATTNVTAVADLSITKGDSPDPVNAGAALTYTLNVANAGPSAASTVSVSDTLPAGVTFVSATGTGWACNNVAGTVTCTRATLAVGAGPAITITVNAPGSGGLITNNASVTATEFDPNAANNAASASTNVTPLANLSITKTDSPDPANTSVTLTYTITVANAGPSNASALTMTDTLPAGVAYLNATGTGWTCNQAAGVVTCTRPSLGLTTAPVITITVTTPATPGSISNTATIAATETDPTPANNTATATTSVAIVTADMSIVKTDTPDPVNAGAAITYTLAVSNAGPDPANTVSVVDTLPAGVTFVSASGTGWTCNNAAGTVTCTRPALAVGAAPSITITGTAPVVGGPVTNTAVVTAAEADNNAANNTSSATTTVTAIADLSLTKTDGPDPVNAGAALTYTINVANAGPSAAANVSVADTLPAGAGFVSATGTGWVCNNAAGTVTCTRAALAVGAAPAITISVTAPVNGGSITNSATVSSATNDPAAGNNTGTAATTVTAVNDLSIVKTASAPSVAATAAFSYTLAVANAGPSQSGTVAVTDPLPAGAVYVSASGTGWTCSQAAGTVTCTRPSLAVGAAPTITINVTAPNSAATLNNTATVAATGDPAAGNNTSSASVTVTAAADLRLTKTAGASSVVDGSNLTYTLSVRNLGPSNATNVVVTDSLPSGASFVSASGSGWTCSVSRGTGNTIICTRPSLGVAVAPAITLVVNIFTDGKGGTICNSATVDSDETDPVPTDNTGQVCVDVVPPGLCGSLEALLQQASDGGIPLSWRLQFMRTLRSAIDARNGGLRSAEIQRIALFINLVTQAKASGSVDAGTADSLTSCAVALRQQALDEVKFGTPLRR